MNKHISNGWGMFQGWESLWATGFRNETNNHLAGGLTINASLAGHGGGHADTQLL